MKKPNEATALFARRLQDKALKYLNHCYENTADQYKQIFVTVMIENARLNSFIHSTVVTLLVTIAASRNELF